VKRFIALFKETFNQRNHRDAPRMGAALAFHSPFSAPLVILIVGICALVFGAAGAQARLLEQFGEMVGEEELMP